MRCRVFPAVGAYGSVMFGTPLLSQSALVNWTGDGRRRAGCEGIACIRRKEIKDEQKKDQGAYF